MPDPVAVDAPALDLQEAMIERLGGRDAIRAGRRCRSLRRRIEGIGAGKRPTQARRLSHRQLILRGMQTPMIYRPGQTASPDRRTCRTCAHFHGERVANGAHVVCRRRDRRQVHASPSTGCAFHQREPGTD
jgi:hypothetical protein